MKGFKEFLAEKKASYTEVRKWVFDKLENTEMDSEEMEKLFIKKFGKESVKLYNRALSEYMD